MHLKCVSSMIDMS